MLVLKNIVKDYITGDTTVRALKGIDINFRESEFVAVLGPSGCGKTTTLRIIGGFEEPSSGDVLFENKKMTNPSTAEKAQLSCADQGFSEKGSSTVLRKYEDF